MEKIVKEGKELNQILDEIINENNLDKNDIVYKSEGIKGGLFKGSLLQVTVYKKEDIINDIKNYLEEVISNLGVDVKFEVKFNEERPIIKMYSDNNPILIGKNGNTIKALEELVKQYILKNYDVYYRINLDVENYRAKKEKSLEHLGLKLAREVRQTKQEIKLDNMTSYERRIIHNALTDFKGVKTESEGEEPNRHIVIKPV